jgi:hypothetical protein
LCADWAQSLSKTSSGAAGIDFDGFSIGEAWPRDSIPHTPFNEAFNLDTRAAQTFPFLRDFSFSLLVLIIHDQVLAVLAKMIFAN